MCSILGSHGFLEPQQFDNLNQKLKHRGPNNSTTKKYSFVNKPLFLGHNRLSVQDLDKKANQPMENERFVLIFNGEIYLPLIYLI